MAISLSPSAQVAAEQVSKRPNLVLEIDGLSRRFSALPLEKLARIGDENLFIGTSPQWVIGGVINDPNVDPLISFERGTSTQISQELDQFSGRGASVSSVSLNIVDLNGELTTLIAPGEVFPDILGRQALVYLGFDDTAFPDDFAPLFRGIVDDVIAGAGFVTLRVAHPDQKKRSEILPKIDTELVGNITNAQTTLTVEDASKFVVGPALAFGQFDQSFRSYIQIEDELIQYTGKTGNQLTGLTRAQIGTPALAHESGASVSTFYRLTGNAIDLALKLMLSKSNAPAWTYLSGLEVSSIVRLSVAEAIPNTVFFQSLNIADRYGLTPGDIYTISGSSISGNNGTGRVVSVEYINGASHVTLDPDGANLSEEAITNATISFQSRYATLPVGLGLKPEEVDILEHERIRDQFLSSFELDFYVKDTINAKEFIEKELYAPAACFSLPRKSRASLGYHIPPLPGAFLKTIDAQVVTNVSELRVRRSITKNFYNAIVYKYDALALEDKFRRGVITTNEDSLARIPVGNKVITFESQGLRQSLNAQSLIATASERRLNKYKFAAEWIENVRLPFGFGFDIEIGDIVVVDLSSLKLSDSQSGTREGEPRLFEVDNKRLDLKTGDVSLTLVDSGFEINARYGLISPSSRIKGGGTQASFVIEPFGASEFDEYRKWENLVGARVIIRRPDYSLSQSTTLVAVNNNTITVSPSLTSAPLAGDIFELDVYTDQPGAVKVRYTFMSDGANDFADGEPPYQMI